MAAKGYTTTDEVAAFLSRTLTDEQVTQLGKIIEAAEQWIDDKIGYGYLGDPVMGRYYSTWNNEFYIGPVADITSLEYFGHAQEIPFSLLDNTTGRVRISYEVRDGTGVIIDYVPLQEVPARVNRAATILSAHWLMPTLDPDRFGVSQYAFSGDYSVTLNTAVIPPEVYELIQMTDDVRLA